MDASSFGQNAYFYDAAEGLLTATILLVAEFCAPEKRHIVSVFKIIQELLAPSPGKKGKNQFQQLMELLPNDHKAKWFAGAALNTAEQSMASVMSTALSRSRRGAVLQRKIRFLRSHAGGKPQHILHGLADYPTALS